MSGTAHGLFREQARRRPGACALDGGPCRTLSYAEAAALADRRAALLRGRGAGPETAVGVHLRDRLDTVLWVLGIWRAGAAFVAVDPGLPRRRQEQVLRETAAPLVVTDDPEALAWATAAPVPSTLDLPEPDGVPDPGVTGSGLAYVCYTSGSTGLPKGALLEHAGVANLTLGLRELFGDLDGARVLQFAPLTFDVWIWELAISVLSGGTLVVPRGDIAGRAGQELAAVLREHRVTHFSAAPSLLGGLPEELPPDLTTLVSGGEPLPAELVRRWGRRVRLINAYGPTETTVCATAGVCVPEEDGAPPAGRPLPGVDVRVLGPDGEPVPDGGTGEVCIGGVQVARGSLDRPEATAERFGPPGALPRTYRTGDLARWTPDGRLRFAGRVDRQIKLRGYRIEPGEVEEALRAHPAVTGAAVVAVGDTPETRRLAAHLQLGDAPAPTIEDLRAFLRTRLPEHMVPSLVQFVARLPLSEHGKVDHARLPEIVRERPPLAGPPEPPAGDREAALAALWEDLLMVRGIGATDRFFDLGGTSIDLLTLRARIEERWNVRLGVADLARAPTVRHLDRLMARLAAGAPALSTACPDAPSRRSRADALRRVRDRHHHKRDREKA